MTIFNKITHSLLKLVNNDVDFPTQEKLQSLFEESEKRKLLRFKLIAWREKNKYNKKEAAYIFTTAHQIYYEYESGKRDIPESFISFFYSRAALHASLCQLAQVFLV